MKVVVYSKDDDVIILPLKLEDSKKAIYFGEDNRDIEEYDREVMRLNEGLVISIRGIRVSGDIVPRKI
jgi:hypothetical protein